MIERLIELETRLAFQDQAFQELNNVVIRQQQDIAALARQLEILKGQIQALAQVPGTHPSDEPPPPHY